jgi:hypothetical protein
VGRERLADERQIISHHSPRVAELGSLGRTTRMAKFAVFNEAKEWIAHDYGNIFFRQPMSSGERLVIGPSSGHVDVILDLARKWRTQEFYILYVLLVSRTGAESGRYQSPLIESFEDLQVLFHTYEAFFESDGRHHIWVGSPTNDGLLIYDQHNVLFAYGDLSRYEEILTSRGYSRREFWFPSPHSHSYEPTNDQQEEQLLRHFPWQRTPLQVGDEWD